MCGYCTARWWRCVYRWCQSSSAHSPCWRSVSIDIVQSSFHSDHALPSAPPSLSLSSRGLQPWLRHFRSPCLLVWRSAWCTMGQSKTTAKKCGRTVHHSAMPTLSRLWFFNTSCRWPSSRSPTSTLGWSSGPSVFQERLKTTEIKNWLLPSVKYVHTHLSAIHVKGKGTSSRRSDMDHTV